jgi:hypothetical protein
MAQMRGLTRTFLAMGVALAAAGCGMSYAPLPAGSTAFMLQARGKCISESFISRARRLGLFLSNFLLGVRGRPEPI